MVLHRLAFAQDVLNGSVSPALLYDETDFPPLQGGWQLLNEADAEDHHHAFVYDVVPEEWDWQCITEEERPALYAQVASRALDQRPSVISASTLASSSSSSSSSSASTALAAARRRRRPSLASKGSTAACESRDLGLELHVQYKSSHRRLRRSISAKQHHALRRHQCAPAVIDHSSNKPAPTATARQVSGQTRKRRQRVKSKKTALEHGLDWAVACP